MSTALIIVDVQNDFCPGGSMAVEGGDDVARRISRWLESGQGRYQQVFATMDWHPAPGHSPGFDHFSDEPDFVDTWPPHCVAETPGAELHPDLVLPADAVMIHKGQSTAAYSGFEGDDANGTPLGELLGRTGVDAVDIVGLATDYCVKATALDAARHDLKVRVLAPMVAGVAADSTTKAVEEMRAVGVTID